MQPSTPDTCIEFYGFRGMPFSMAYDGDQNNIYLSQNYETSLAIIVSSLDRYMSLTLVLGVDGVGKTTLINYIFKHIQQDYIVGMLDGHIKSTQELFQKTLASFGHIPKKNGAVKMLQQLQIFLNAEFEHRGGQPSLLIIDDADNMSLDALEGIEQLLSLNNESRRILQLILVGKPELEQLLNAPKLYALSKTARARCSVEPLTAEETQHYINYRLNLVGAVDKKLFDKQVCSVVFDFSKGIPRKINSICDDALLRSCSAQTHKITTAFISEAANDSEQAGLADQMARQFRLDSPASSDTKGSGKLFKSLLATGLIFTSSVLVLVFFLRERLFSPSEDQNIEISHNVNRHLGRNNNNNKMPNSLPPSQKKERLENLEKKDALPDENLQNVITTKTATRNLLATAERHLLAFRLSTPDGENALDIYRGILEREPNNKIALKGIKQIAKKYTELADRESRRGAISNANKYLEQAATLFPESDAIQKALDQTKKIQVQAKMPKVASQQASDDGQKTGSLAVNKTVAKLLMSAEQQFSESKFLLPKTDNAYNTYTEILSISPNNKRAYAGLQRIANHYLAQAKKQRTKGKLEKSQLLIAQGLKVLPQHKKLAALKKQVIAESKYNQEAVFAAVEIKKTVDTQIENLLIQAENQRQAQQLTQPIGNNALESYNKALQIDPNNVKAKKGLVSIAKQYQALVRAALSNGDTDQALAAVNEGLAAFPKSPELLISRDNVMLQQQKILKKTEVPAKKKSKDNDRGLRYFGTF